MGSMITANYDSETDQIIDASPRLSNGVANSSVPVTAILSSGGVKKIGAGASDTYLPDDTPIICIGGDHPYSQWWGTNGNNGMAEAYLSRGLKPYIAINTYGDGPGSNPELHMPWDQVKSLSAIDATPGFGFARPWPECSLLT